MTLASGSAHGQVILYSNMDGTLTPQSAYYSQPFYLNSSAYAAPVYVPSSAFNSSFVSSSTVPLYVNFSAASSSISPSAMATAAALIQACENQGIDPATLLSSSASANSVSSAQASNAAAWQFLIPLIPEIVDLLLGDGGRLGGGGGGGSNARLDRIERKLDLLLEKRGVETGNGNGNGGGAGGGSDLAELLKKLIPILLDRIGNRNNGGGNSGGNNGGGADNGRTEDVIRDSFDRLSISSASSTAASRTQSFASQTGTSVGDVQRALEAVRRYQSCRFASQEADPEDALNDAVSSYEVAMKAVEEAAINVKRQKILATTELQIQKLRAEADKKVAEIEGKKPEKSVEARLKALDKRLKALLAD